MFPFFIMLYGLGTFVSGALLAVSSRFWLIEMACLHLRLAIGASWVNCNYEMLFGAAALILISYIVLSLSAVKGAEKIFHRIIVHG